MERCPPLPLLWGQCRRGQEQVLQRWNQLEPPGQDLWPQPQGGPAAVGAHLALPLALLLLLLPRPLVLPWRLGQLLLAAAIRRSQRCLVVSGRGTSLAAAGRPAPAVRQT